MNGAVITALNEGETIMQLVKTLRGLGFSVCVVDDGSIDYTYERASIAGAHVIRHDKPQGIGKSLVEAWRYALAQGWDYTVQIDAGGSHDPHSLFNWTDSKKPDVLIGSRFKGQYIGNKKRAWLSWLVTQACNFATHEKITDWTSGYRVFSRKALLELSKTQYLTNMHTWQIEVLHEALRKGLEVKEFPITYRAGTSSIKLSVVSDLIKVYLWVFFV